MLSLCLLFSLFARVEVCSITNMGGIMKENGMRENGADGVVCIMRIRASTRESG